MMRNFCELEKWATVLSQKLYFNICYLSLWTKKASYNSALRFVSDYPFLGPYICLKSSFSFGNSEKVNLARPLGPNFVSSIFIGEDQKKEIFLSWTMRKW